MYLHFFYLHEFLRVARRKIVCFVDLMGGAQKNVNQ